MKKDVFKIILLLLILVAIPFIIIIDKDNAQESYVDNYLGLSKDENWEYVKVIKSNQRTFY